MQHQILHQANSQQIRRVTQVLDWPQLTDRVNDWIEGRRMGLGYLTDIWPCLITKACGGDEMRTIPLASAWTLYRLGARLFDDILDSDSEPDATQMSLTQTIFMLANMCLADYDVCQSNLKHVLADLSQTWAFGFRSLVTKRDFSFEQYFQYRIASDAALYVAIAKAAMVGTNVNEQTVAALEDYALHAGLAAAIASDCEDVHAQAEKRSDLENEEYTLPVLYVLEQQPDLAGQSAALLQALETSDALQRAQDVAADYASRAVDALAVLAPENRRDLERYVTN